MSERWSDFERQQMERNARVLEQALLVGLSRGPYWWIKGPVWWRRIVVAYRKRRGLRWTP